MIRIRHGKIKVFEDDRLGELCPCGAEAGFQLIIAKSESIYLCETCLADIGHCVIDALI